MVDTRTTQTFAARLELKNFSIGNTTAYNRYRFRVTANGGATATQLSEVQLFGY